MRQSLFQKIKAVERVYKNLDTQLQSFQKDSGLHCKSACGECCKKPDIEATAIEFLPFAYHLYKTDKAFEFLEILKERGDHICVLFSPFAQYGSFGGSCTDYTYRGLICRLFGFSARKDKEGKAELVTCKIIKTEQVDAYNNIVARIKEGSTIPIMSDFYMQMSSIDFDLGTKFYPINDAIKLAIEHVLGYYAYRGKRAS